MTKYKIIFWISTIIIFLTQGVLEVLTFNSPMAIEGIKHLGYPEYFLLMLVVAKVLGVLALIIPTVSRRIKEWAYAGFTFDFIAAFISISVVDGFGFNAVLPLIFLVILAGSYYPYRKLTTGNF